MNTTRKGGRPATGSLKWCVNPDTGLGPFWHARVTLKTGERRLAPLDPKIPHHDVIAAKVCAKLTSEHFRTKGYIDAGIHETVGEYAKRWLAHREGRGQSTRDNESHLKTHILPVIGLLDMRAVTSEDIRRLVDALDAKAAKGGKRAKTMLNVWGTCTKMFDDAARAKDATGLKCLDVDPTDKVRGPDDDDSERQKQFLYPSELLAFLNAPSVPALWKRNVAIAVYLKLRHGEQRALKWSSVDLEHGIVTVVETFDRDTDQDRDGTKGGRARTVAIHPELVPLLVAMRKRAGGRGHVCNLGSSRNMASGLRRYLAKAGVDRAALHTTTSVNKQITWHDLRASGATYMAVEGATPMAIRDSLGHQQTSQTDVYVRSAEILKGGRFGQPFPVLPEAVYWGLEVSVGFGSRPKPGSVTTSESFEKLAERAGFEPAAEFCPAPA
jgi:integrase